MVIAAARAGTLPPDKAFLLKPHYLWCRDSKDIVELADIGDPAELREAFLRKVDSGDCMASVDSYVPITAPEERRTPKGNRYLCFNLRYEEGVKLPASDPECTFPRFVTTIAAEIRVRKGTHRMEMDVKDVKVAKCDEGGLVSLSRIPDGWERHSTVFPGEETTAVKIGQSRPPRSH